MGLRAPPPANVVFRHLPEWAMFRTDNCYVRFIALIPDLRVVVSIAVDFLRLFNELLRSELRFSRTFCTTALLVKMITWGLTKRTVIWTNNGHVLVSAKILDLRIVVLIPVHR